MQDVTRTFLSPTLYPQSMTGLRPRIASLRNQEEREETRAGLRIVLINRQVVDTDTRHLQHHHRLHRQHVRLNREQGVPGVDVLLQNSLKYLSYIALDYSSEKFICEE